ncbi:MAG: hypothetical protein WCE90_08030 [Candidatus Zixiibacteriota bacterium]|jgi:hypothetical protein
MAEKDKRKIKPQIKPIVKASKADGKAILPFTKRNYLLFGIGLFVIVVGYITLGYGSITLAPILLVLGYCVIIPIAIIVGEKEKPKEQARKEPERPPSGEVLPTGK